MEQKIFQYDGSYWTEVIIEVKGGTKTKRLYLKIGDHSIYLASVDMELHKHKIKLQQPVKSSFVPWETIEQIHDKILYPKIPHKQSGYYPSGEYIIILEDPSYEKLRDFIRNPAMELKEKPQLRQVA